MWLCPRSSYAYSCGCVLVVLLHTQMWLCPRSSSAYSDVAVSSFFCILRCGWVLVLLHTQMWLCPHRSSAYSCGCVLVVLLHTQMWLCPRSSAYSDVALSSFFCILRRGCVLVLLHTQMWLCPRSSAYSDVAVSSFFCILRCGCVLVDVLSAGPVVASSAVGHVDTQRVVCNCFVVTEGAIGCVGAVLHPTGIRFGSTGTAVVLV